MNSKTIQNLQYFVGKVCSVFTSPVNRSFDELHAREHFVARIQEINADGIWGTHPHSGMMSFFAMPHVMLLAEEIELDPSNPEHAQMLQEFEQRTGKRVVSDVAPSPKQTAPPEEVPFVDIANLEKLALDTKRQYDRLDQQKPVTQLKRQ